MKHNRGFTLVELLVVIGVIAVLISILLPTIGRARSSADRMMCQSNLRQTGIAMMAYISENKGSFPYHEFWYNQQGPRGNLEKYNIAPFAPVSETGFMGEKGVRFERPLNRYLKNNAQVSMCPSDRGDARKTSVINTFDAYGTSYQIQWNDGSLWPGFGVVPVTGWSELRLDGLKNFNVKTLPAAKHGASIRLGNRVFKGPWSQKIILGDFNWHGNRPISDKRVLWHPPSKQNTRQQNMLFGDGHVEFFMFPSHYGDYYLPVNLGKNGFW